MADQVFIVLSELSSDTTNVAAGIADFFKFVVPSTAIVHPMNIVGL